MVAPLEIFPDPQNCLISHMCLPAYKSKLQNTVAFFYSAFRFVYHHRLPWKLTYKFSGFCCIPCIVIDVQSIFSSHYEEYLGEKFPFGSYKQIFIAPEMAVSSSSLGASMSIFSSQVLYDENIIDKVWLHNMSVVLPLCKLRYMCICAKTQYLGDV